MQHVWERGKVYTRFWWGNLRERDRLVDPSVDRRIILKWIFRKWDWDMDWIDLARDRDRWRAVVMRNHDLLKFALIFTFL
jgi:hypothetical protein